MGLPGTVTCSLLLAVSLGAPRAHGGSSGKTAEAVRGFVQGFYGWYVPKALKTGGDSEADALKYKRSAFSPELFRALKEDWEAQAKVSGWIVGLDFDPFLNTQDPCGRYEVGAVTHHKDRYLVEIYGVCAGKRNRNPDVIAEVARWKGSWVFANFRYRDVDDPDSTFSTDLLSTLRLLREDRRESPRSPPARSAGVDQRVAVKATCAPTRVRGRDELVVDIQVVNTDRRPLRLPRGLMVGATLHLTFTDQRGKEVEHQGIELELARSESKSAFLALKPGGFVATRLRLVRQTSRGRTYYVLRDPDTHSELHRYFIGPQGRYTLVVEYASGDDGRLAGIHAWTGVARSPKIRFALPQEKA